MERGQSGNAPTAEEWEKVRRKLYLAQQAAIRVSGHARARASESGFPFLIAAAADRTRSQLSLLEHIVVTFKGTIVYELAAGVARSLWELRATLMYLTKDPAKVTDFEAAFYRDLKDVSEAVRAGVRDERLRNDLDSSLTEQLRDLSAKGIDISATWPTGRQLAKLAGDELEYEQNYKVLSKFAHPTPWLIYAGDAGFEMSLIGGTMVLKAIEYAHGVLNLVMTASARQRETNP